MAEGFEAYHVPQQSRRDKLRVVVTQNQQQPLLEPSTLLPLYDPSSFISSDLLTTFHNNNHASKRNLGCAVKEERSNLMMGFAASSSSCSSNSSSVSYLDPESSLPLNQATIQVINNSNNNNNNNLFLYQTQNLREFDQSYNNSGGGEIMVFKPEPLSLSLSSNNNNNSVNLQRCGSVMYGDKVGGGCVIYGGSASNEVLRGTVPMGPFTGYASVLKGSRFLKPAQQLLGELCDVGGVCAEKMMADTSLMEPIPPSPPHEISTEDPLGDHAFDGRKKSRLLTMLDEEWAKKNTVNESYHLGNGATVLRCSLAKSGGQVSDPFQEYASLNWAFGMITMPRQENIN
ncbi:hypothetical protein VNO77_08151 [Canavalia gladiata]|uniref:Uncharacterized protein n=1 Tax=Canavalia gladiata TaxID=3824 RepID=A0AAN9M887_CANGL